MPKATTAAAIKIDACSVLIGAASCVAMAAPLVYSIAGALVSVSFNYHKHTLPWLIWYVCASVAGGFMLTPLVLEALDVDARNGWFFMGAFVAVPFLRTLNGFNWRRLFTAWTSPGR